MSQARSSLSAEPVNSRLSRSSSTIPHTCHTQRTPLSHRHPHRKVLLNVSRTAPRYDVPLWSWSSVVCPGPTTSQNCPWSCGQDRTQLLQPSWQRLNKGGISLKPSYLVTRRFLSLRNRACVMMSLWPLSLYSPHSLMMSHTITSVS